MQTSDDQQNAANQPYEKSTFTPSKDRSPTELIVHLLIALFVVLVGVSVSIASASDHRQQPADVDLHLSEKQQRAVMPVLRGAMEEKLALLHSFHYTNDAETPNLTDDQKQKLYKAMEHIDAQTKHKLSRILDADQMHTLEAVQRHTRNNFNRQFEQNSAVVPPMH